MRPGTRVALVLLVIVMAMVLVVTALVLPLILRGYQDEPPAPTVEPEPMEPVSAFVVPSVLLSCVEPERETEEPVEAVDPEPDIPVLTKVEAWTPAEADVNALARTLWGECRGVESKAEQAAVAWCILNRLDAGYADTVTGVCAAPGQFAGYSVSHPLDDELIELARDVLTRHHREAEGEVKVGRTLPSNYYYFTGREGRNWFRKEFRSSTYWDWSLPDPYKEE